MGPMAAIPAAHTQRGRPISPALPRQVWRSAAIGAGNLAAWASRRTGRGSGASIRGQVITKLYPDAFTELVAGRRIAAISGTNGKTTTTHLLTAALRAWVDDPTDVVTNADGANLREGIASALSQQVHAPIAILETDEQIVPAMVRAGHPEVLVMLNFSRDQLDRHHEIKSLGKKWRDALAEAGGKGPVVVANIHDPLVTWAAEAAQHTIWVDMGIGWTQDAALCPNCGTVLRYGGDNGWSCPGCMMAQHPADFSVSGDQVTGPHGEQWLLDLAVPGRFNRGNATCALAAAIVMGVDPAVAVQAMSTVRAPAGRFSTGHFGETTARLLLAKNPAGWAESLLVMQSDPVVLAIDSAIADGTDVSWLWDVEYEQLAGRHVVCTGPRAQDLAVRLSYAGVEHSIVPSLTEAMHAHYDHPVDVLATYTAFLHLCRMGGVTW